jgi:hypothetical protein
MYLTNAEFMISSLLVASKTMLMIYIISFAYGISLDSRMFDKILYVVDGSHMPL